MRNGNEEGSRRAWLSWSLIIGLLVVVSGCRQMLEQKQLTEDLRAAKELGTRVEKTQVKLQDASIAVKALIEDLEQNQSLGDTEKLADLDLGFDVASLGGAPIASLSEGVLRDVLDFTAAIAAFRQERDKVVRLVEITRPMLEAAKKNQRRVRYAVVLSDSKPPTVNLGAIEGGLDVESAGWPDRLTVVMDGNDRQSLERYTGGRIDRTVAIPVAGSIAAFDSAERVALQVRSRLMALKRDLDGPRATAPGEDPGLYERSKALAATLRTLVPEEER